MPEEGSRAVATLEPRELDTTNPIVLGKLCAQSEMFQDAKDAAKAFVKIQAGRELGLPPIAAMTSIHVFAGRVTIGSNAIAAVLKGSEKYDFRVIESTADRCEIEFIEIRNGNERVIGTWDYSIQDAKQAGLLEKDNWQHAPRDMCFARALMGGARKFCGDVVCGVYDPDEVETPADVRRRDAAAIDRGRKKHREKSKEVEAEVIETTADTPNDLTSEPEAADDAGEGVV